MQYTELFKMKHLKQLAMVWLAVGNVTIDF